MMLSAEAAAIAVSTRHIESIFVVRKDIERDGKLYQQGLVYSYVLANVHLCLCHLRVLTGQELVREDRSKMAYRV